MTQEELQYGSDLRSLMHVPPEKFLKEFMRLTVRSGIKIPEQVALSYSVQKRPMVIRAFLRAFESAELLYGRLREFQGPVYVAFGDQSHPVMRIRANRLQKLFTDCRVEVYEGAHSLAPPHVVAPVRFANALRKVWQRSIESSSGSG